MNLQVPSPSPVCRIAIVGAGPAGLAAAALLARRGLATILIGPDSDPADTRTTALLGGTVHALQEAGAWPALAPHASPLRIMAIIDATRRLVRSPPIAFRAEEIGEETFGWNIANGDMTRALSTFVASLSQVERIRDHVAKAECLPDRVVLTLAGGGAIETSLAVAADGRSSPTRIAAGIGTRDWRYPQAALALSFSHTRPHHDTSTEFHTESGPFTLVPLAGDRSSLVWVVRPAEARRLMALDNAALSLEIERRSHSLLGKVALGTPRSLWPMSGLSAETYGRRRVALIGEAAHVFPPIGAQGFNLTMRDVTALVEAVADVADPGGEAVLAAYDRARRADVGSRTAMIDLLNRSLLTGFLPVQVARSVGFRLLERIGPLRRIAMRQGLAPGISLARALGE